MSFLSDLLDEYGSPIDRYVGTGELRSGSGASAVEFAAAQYADGRVLLACEGDPHSADAFWTPRQLVARVDESTTLTCKLGGVELPMLVPPQKDEGVWAVYVAGSITRAVHADGVPSEHRYLLTNLEFDGGAREGFELDLPGFTHPLIVEPVETDVWSRLRALKHAVPSAVLTIQRDEHSAIDVRKTANAVTYLMSVARGTKVQWIQEELRVPGGPLKYLIHGNRVTKRFTTLAPIDPRRCGPLKDFLEACYTTYEENRDQFLLERGTIDAVLDARVEDDFLESRGVKLAVALEGLKEAVLASLPETERYLVPPAQHDEVVKQVHKGFRSALINAGVPGPAADSMSSHGRLGGLNRAPFRKLLQKVADRLDVSISSRDLRLFVSCRDHLVHRGDFYCASATEAERAELPPHDSRFEEYVFLLGIIDAFLLRLVGWRGEYLVRRGGSEFELRTVTGS